MKGPMAQGAALSLQTDRPGLESPVAGAAVEMRLTVPEEDRSVDPRAAMAPCTGLR